MGRLVLVEGDMAAAPIIEDMLIHMFEVMQHLMDCGNILSGGCVEISDKTFHFLSLFQQIRIFTPYFAYNF